MKGLLRAVLISVVIVFVAPLTIALVIVVVERLQDHGSHRPADPVARCIAIAEDIHEFDAFNQHDEQELTKEYRSADCVTICGPLEEYEPSWSKDSSAGKCPTGRVPAAEEGARVFGSRHRM